MHGYSVMKVKIPKFLVTIIVTLSILISSSVHVQAYNGFSIGVNYVANVVNVYYYGEPLYAFVCSTGSATPRSGTYYTQSKWRWRGLFGNVFGQYATSITGNILFHSVPYYDTYEWALEWWEYDKLGTSASMGCVRLQVCDAKWIFDNCPLGTPVTFYGSEDPGPWGKPQAYKISDAPEDIRNWDPTDPNPYNAWNYNDDFTKYTFNAQQYLKYNPDLQDAIGTDEFSLKVHWLTAGIKEKRRASDEFDLKFYMSFYPELVEKFGDDMYSYVEYYNKYGKDAGQIASEKNTNFKFVFDAQYYADSNPDVKAKYGYDLDGLWLHYKKYGIYENRAGSRVFTFSYYRSQYPDLCNEFGDDIYKYFRYFIEQGMPEGQQAISSFDVLSYRSQYPDLRKAFGNDLKKYYNHYLVHGFYEGRVGTGCTEVVGATTVLDGVDYSKVYDYYFYTENHPDVKNTYPMDDVAVLRYFVTQGMSEGQQAISSFDVMSYKRQYPDLRNAFGDDLVKYYCHYIINGSREGRIGTGCTEVVGATTVLNGVDYSKVYDYYYYIEHQPDVKNAYPMDDEAVLRHFVTHGMHEGRQAISTFDVMSYKRQYPDLRNAFGDDLVKYYCHYIISGSREGRIGTGCTEVVGATTVIDGVDYSKVYDYYYYTEKYPDIKAAYGYDDVEILKYFVEQGMNEGQQASSSFNVFSYKRQYPDLRKAYGDDLKKYYKHYLVYGFSEGRVGTGCTEIVGATTILNGVDYSKVYDYYYYTDKYPDIKETYVDDVETLKYFVDYGMSEGHQAIDSFDVNSYRMQYPELRQAFGYDLSKYFEHYMEYGYDEGLVGTGCTEIVGATTVYNGVDYSKVYDYYYYIENYPDVKAAYENDDVAALEYFVEYGMSEGHQAIDSFDVLYYKSQNPELEVEFGDELEKYYYHYMELETGD